MIELILLLVCSWQIHKLATSLSLSPMSWVIRFFVLFLGLLFLFAQILVYTLNLKPEDDILLNSQKILPYVPILYALIIGLYFFFRFRMKRFASSLNQPGPPDEPTPPDEPEDENPPKKDLSYFR